MESKITLDLKIISGAKGRLEFQFERILLNLPAGLYRPAGKSSRIRSASQMSHGLACCVPADTVILLALHHNTVTFGFVVLNGDGNSLVVAFDGTRNYKEDYLYTDVNLILVETV